MRTPLILGVALLLGVAPAASAHSKHGKHAKVSKAHLEATAAATAAGIPDARGRAQLVDGRRHDKVSLHMKGLKPGETYLWHVHQATGEGDPCAADSTVGNPVPYPGFTYRALTANDSGNANSKGTSTTFPDASLSGGDYYVNVHLQDGTVIACGVLARKQHHAHHKHGHGHDNPGKAKNRDRDHREDA